MREAIAAQIAKATSGWWDIRGASGILKEGFKETCASSPDTTLDEPDSISISGKN
jgi:hypothetical protein